MYYGWRIVLFTAMIYGVVLGFTYSSFGLFVIPVAEDLNLSRADINSALILLNMGSAFLAPMIGRALDHFPARRIMISSALLSGMSFFVLSVSTSLWLSAFAITVTLAASLQGAGTLTNTVLLARWFTIQRARALLLATMGGSLCSIAIAPAVGYLIEHEGWRTALQVMGAVMTVVLLAIALLIRERPAPGELEGTPRQPVAAGTSPPRPQPTAPEKVSVILKMPKFWTIGISAAIAMAIVQSISITLVPLAVKSGMSTIQAAGLISVTGSAAVVTKLVLAAIADRFDRVNLLATLFALGIVVNLSLLLASGQAILYGCALLLGVASSAIAPTFYALLADKFELASFGTVRGMMATIVAILGAISMRIAGEVFDIFGHYDPLFSAFMVLGLLSVGLMLFTRKLAPTTVA